MSQIVNNQQEMGLIKQFSHFANQDDFPIPTIPQNAMRLIDLLNNPNSSTEEIESVVSLDPVIAGHILKTANSAIYGGRIELTSIKPAITRLGRKKLRNVIFIISVKISFVKDKNYREEMMKIWNKSLFCAFFCQAIAKKMQANDEELFLVGLMHNIGKLVIISALQNFLKRIPNYAFIEPDLLEMLYDIHQAHLGKQLLVSWKIPDKIVAAIALQSRSSDQEQMQAKAILSVAKQSYEAEPNLEELQENLNYLGQPDNLDLWAEIAKTIKQEISTLL